MTRFAASTADGRRDLVADAIAAHRERASAFCTVEPDPVDEETPPPWIQYGDGRLNLDCTDEEVARLKSLLDDYPSVIIDELTRPEDAEGTNVRIEAHTDDDRVAELVDDVYLAVFEREPDYRLWITEV